jgi:hypothetical protein
VIQIRDNVLDGFDAKDFAKRKGANVEFPLSGLADNSSCCLLVAPLKRLVPTTSKSLVRLTPRKHEHEQLFETLLKSRGWFVMKSGLSGWQD